MTICGHLTLACFAGTRSASSVSFHFIKNINSPLVSVAPIMRSGWRPLSKPSLRSDFFFAEDFDSLGSAFRFFASLAAATMKGKCDDVRSFRKPALFIHHTFPFLLVLFECWNKFWAIQVLFRFPCVVSVGVSFPFQVIFNLRRR